MRLRVRHGEGIHLLHQVPECGDEARLWRPGATAGREPEQRAPYLEKLENIFRPKLGYAHAETRNAFHELAFLQRYERLSYRRPADGMLAGQCEFLEVGACGYTAGDDRLQKVLGYLFGQ